MSELREIPGIGKTFVKDFERINIRSLADLRKANPEALFERLVAANEVVDHSTSKNYLYVIRMAAYYARGGRDPAKLKWSAWKDVKPRK